jgi:hypothetical protein
MIPASHYFARHGLRSKNIFTTIQTPSDCKSGQNYAINTFDHLHSRSPDYIVCPSKYGLNLGSPSRPHSRTH